MFYELTRRVYMGMSKFYMTVIAILPFLFFLLWNAF